MKVIAIAQARVGSTRLPGKVMKDLAGKPVLRWTIDALDQVYEIDQVVLATSTLPADDTIAEYCAKHKIECFRGSEQDVLDRLYQCAVKYEADVVLRLTCDCPFLDPGVVAEVIRLREAGDWAYASNINPPSYPDGLDVECFRAKALEIAWKEATRPSDRDCVTQYIVRNRHRFPAGNLRCPLPDLEHERWVLDTQDDYDFCLAISNQWHHLNAPSYLDILRMLDEHPKLRLINKGHPRNERFYEGISTEELPAPRFTRSQALFGRATTHIPFGAQTFSKSHLQFPPGRAPLYVSHADGARIYDVDGNDYVDLVNAVLPVVLGYRDPDVDAAIRHQLDSGISFSLATELEAEVAELLNKHVPCAEATKFGKSGTDVTTAAIRLARAFTGRETVLMTGYHGWADWSMAPTERSLGIPVGVKHLSKLLPYGDYEQFAKHLSTTVAAVIVEPNENAEFLAWLRERCYQVGAVLIFDEVITGFRWSMGGAQKLYGITPDLATFGKAMANGMPLSALCGPWRIMKLMQPPNNIFYSGTMFGEALSLAAAAATINKLDRCQVIDHLWKTGEYLTRGAGVLLDKHKLRHCIELTGQSPRMIVNFRDDTRGSANQIRTMFMQEMVRNGVLIINSHNVSYATGPNEVKRIITAYDRTLKTISEALDQGTIRQLVGTEAATVAPLRANA